MICPTRNEVDFFAGRIRIATQRFSCMAAARSLSDTHRCTSFWQSAQNLTVSMPSSGKSSQRALHLNATEQLRMRYSAAVPVFSEVEVVFEVIGIGFTLSSFPEMGDRLELKRPNPPCSIFLEERELLVSHHVALICAPALSPS